MRKTKARETVDQTTSEIEAVMSFVIAPEHGESWTRYMRAAVLAA
jgi:hypothetical protein